MKTLEIRLRAVSKLPYLYLRIINLLFTFKVYLLIFSQKSQTETEGKMSQVQRAGCPLVLI